MGTRRICQDEPQLQEPVGYVFHSQDGFLSRGRVNLLFPMNTEERLVGFKDYSAAPLYVE